MRIHREKMDVAVLDEVRADLQDLLTAGKALVTRLKEASLTSAGRRAVDLACVQQAYADQKQRLTLYRTLLGKWLAGDLSCQTKKALTSLEMLMAEVAALHQTIFSFSKLLGSRAADLLKDLLAGDVLPS